MQFNSSVPFDTNTLVDRKVLPNRSVLSDTRVPFDSNVLFDPSSRLFALADRKDSSKTARIAQDAKWTGKIHRANNRFRVVMIMSSGLNIAK